MSEGGSEAAKFEIIPILLLTSDPRSLTSVLQKLLERV